VRHEPRRALLVLLIANAVAASMSLGVVLSALGERETGTARLVEAVTAWDLCLTVGDSGWPQERAGAVRSARDQAQAEIARRLSK
jgi:hypothetical protein